MGNLKSLAVAGAVVMAATGVAAAADLRPPPILPAPPVVVAEPVFSGFYLRGDIGVGELDGKFEVIDRNPFVSPQVVHGHDIDFGSFASGGVGVGYQVNNWFRFDVTGEYRTKTDFSFIDKYCEVPGGAGQFCSTAQRATASGQGINYFRGKLGSMVFLANAYVDLGNWSGLTPYLGAGIGFAHHRLSGISDLGTRTAFGTGGAILFTGPTEGYFGNGSETNLAWALMAGLSYDVAPNYKVDIGYRYLNMGDVTSGRAVCGGNLATCDLTVKAKDLESHEIRFGMRWMLGGAPAPVMADAPIHPGRIVKRY